jgi:hypothetical protein
MSIFKETFPQFVENELKRRQDGMLARTPTFTHQLNTRSSWVRMTSGVNYNGNNELAKQYVLQGGTLGTGALGNFLKSGLGGNGTSAYDLKTPGGTTNRLGIRPMPGITNVSVQSKGAYGSLQEATVSFIAWDIRQLEDLELLYMRPGYTVLLEFGWSYVNPIPKYNILDIPNDKGKSLNDAFKELYQKISSNNGNYNALLGYVKNYNWSARDDGGYDCTTTIISLGEVLESLKVNWVPMETKAFEKKGLLGYGPQEDFNPIPHYERGIIPGLLSELFFYMDKKANSGNNLNYSREFKDPNFPGSKYNLYMSKRLGDISKISRGGLNKYLGKGDVRTEAYITLGSLCELINNYVLLKDGNNSPISQITTYDTDDSGNIDKTKPLECIASPLSLSTNYGICFVRNDNWKSLSIQEIKSATDEENALTGVAAIATPAYIIEAIQERDFFPISKGFTSNKVTETEIDIDLALVPDFGLLNQTYYNYSGNLETDLKDIANKLLNSISKVEIKKENDLKPQFTFSNGKSFTSTNSNPSSFINFFDYFYIADDASKKLEFAYIDFFGKDYPSITDITGRTWTKGAVTAKIKEIFFNYPLSELLSKQIADQTSTVASAISESAIDVPGFKAALQFLLPNSSTNVKSLGYIENIYVNLDLLYDQAVSKNVASNDTQSKNTIAIREYIQNILRNIQNSLGNINNFDLQVDSRNAIGRIIDINYTGDPSVNLFPLQIHNLNSVVRTYSFNSKIFPEMGSIIAISAQDATGVGKLGYDNATLVAWNDGISDRLIPKKTFSTNIRIDRESNPSSFLLPFLTKIFRYFESLDSKGTSNPNYLYGGLDFAYRDFLSVLDRYDPQNAYKSIIPTELTVTLDGIGGIIIGNLFQINEDIIPKGYKSVSNRKIGYIVTNIGHNIQGNDWTTTLQAYPIILETAPANSVWKQWNNNEYPNSGTTVVTAGGVPVVKIPSPTASIENVYGPSIDNAITSLKNKGINISTGLRVLATAQTQFEGFYPGSKSFRTNNPGNIGNIDDGSTKAYDTLDAGIEVQLKFLNDVVNGRERNYKAGIDLGTYLKTYATGAQVNDDYLNFIISFFAGRGYSINRNTLLTDIAKINKPSYVTPNKSTPTSFLTTNVNTFINR